MVIEDMRHLELFDAHARELMRVLIVFNEAANGVTDKYELAALREAQMKEFIELLRQQKRAIDHMLGRPIKPETHYAEAVMIGIMGGGEAA